MKTLVFSICILEMDRRQNLKNQNKRTGATKKNSELSTSWIINDKFMLHQSYSALRYCCRCWPTASTGPGDCFPPRHPGLFDPGDSEARRLRPRKGQTGTGDRTGSCARRCSGRPSGDPLGSSTSAGTSGTLSATSRLLGTRPAAVPLTPYTPLKQMK
jgi:hypothetical protein